MSHCKLSIRLNRKGLWTIAKAACLIILCFPLPSLKAQTVISAENSVYQYTVPIGPKQAYLWVPPRCNYVKGIIISFANLLERNWLEDPIIRKEAARDDLAIILVEPDTNLLTAELKIAERPAFFKMLQDLAKRSGYSEIEYAPFIPIDHSVHGVFTWNLAAWIPERVIAAIPVKTFAFPGTLNFKNIPICYITGETDEWPPVKNGRQWSRNFIWPEIRRSALSLRANEQNNLIGVVTDPGGGHLDWSDKLSTFLALYIHKACLCRLPKKNMHQKFVKLNIMLPKSGWLTDSGGLDSDKFKPAPYEKYSGDPKNAYWFFDKETAFAAMEFAGDRKIRKKQMLTFVQNGKQLPISKQGFVNLQFFPKHDGLTFNIQGDFLSTVPQEFKDAGIPIGHAEDDIKFRIITGPAVQTGPNQFRIAFNRSAPGGDVWIQEEHPGNDQYTPAVQPGQIKLPAKIMRGKPQTVTFHKIANQRLNVRQINLLATCNSGLPVNYYVVSGPAIVSGNILKLTPIPIKSRYPVKITLIAYQWGRMNEPLYQSATPVTRSFYITNSLNYHMKNAINSN